MGKKRNGPQDMKGAEKYQCEEAAWLGGRGSSTDFVREILLRERKAPRHREGDMGVIQVQRTEFREGEEAGERRLRRAIEIDQARRADPLRDCRKQGIKTLQRGGGKGGEERVNQNF